MKRERDFQKWFSQRIKDQGGGVYNICGDMMQTRGIPDLCVMHSRIGEALWVELKVRGGSLTTLQRKRARDGNGFYGCPHLVARLIPDSDEIRVETVDSSGAINSEFMTQSWTPNMDLVGLLKEAVTGMRRWKIVRSAGIS